MRHRRSYQPRAAKRPSVALLRLFGAIVFLAALSTDRPSAGQSSPAEVPLRVLSADILRFDAPVRLGTGVTEREYNETLELTVEVERKAMDALPPSMQPLLYIGRQEYGVFKVEEGSREDVIYLFFHIPNWRSLEDGAPIVLTIEQGAPIKDPGRFLKPGVPRFEAKSIVDKR